MPRQKKLAAIKQLEGNPGRRLIEASGIEGIGEPFVAEHLMDDARGCIEVIKQSMPIGVYSRLDSFHLAGFGVAWAIHKKAALVISGPDFEWVVTNSQGSQVVSPWIKMLTVQAGMMATLGDRLGLDPKSRAQLKLPGTKQRKSKFAGLLGQKELSTTLSS